MSSKILFLCLTWWSFAGASSTFPEDLNPLNINFYRQHYLVFSGLDYGISHRKIRLDIQRILIADRTLYVTAVNNIFSINLDTEHDNIIYYSGILPWKPYPEQVKRCQAFGRTQEECHNFIKVLVQKNDKELLICGTSAFEPTCHFNEVPTLKWIGTQFSGRKICPFNGKDHNIALFADGSLYSGTVANFLSTDPLFSRSLGDLPTLRTASQDYDWLKEPHFIHAVDYGNYVYFFFHEVSVEYKNFGKMVLPRVGRVCKNDMGGKKVLQKQWTSFLKARMICSVPGDPPFYFNILESVTNVVEINGRDIVVAVFTTPPNSIPGSAVCAFDMQEIEKVFAGSFARQKDHDTIWTPVPEEDVPTPRPGSCAGSPPFEEYTSSTEFPDKVHIFMRMHHLMMEAVPSTHSKPWFLQTMVRYYLTKIVLDTSAGPKGDQIVAFLGTERGIVLKVWDRSGDGPLLSESILVEEMNIFNREKCHYKDDSDLTIVSMDMDKPSGALYVAFVTCVIKVPLGSCELYGKCKKSCIAFRDPYCGWVKESGECKQLSPGDTQDYEQDLENGDVSGMDDCDRTKTRRT